MNERVHGPDWAPTKPPETTTVRRPFHWGIVIVAADDWAGDLPEVDPDSLVTASERTVIIGVRHAQDSDEFDGEVLKLAEAEVVVRKLGEAASSSESRREVFRTVITVPTGRLTVGDADEEVVVSAHPGANTVLVSVDAQVPRDDMSPDAVQVDLLPG